VGKFQVRQPALPRRSLSTLSLCGEDSPGRIIDVSPAVFGEGSVRFSDVKKGFESMRNVLILTPVEDAAIPVNWDQGKRSGWQERISNPHHWATPNLENFRPWRRKGRVMKSGARILGLVV